MHLAIKKISSSSSIKKDPPQENTQQKKTFAEFLVEAMENNKTTDCISE